MKNQKGMTLIEIIVALVICAIFITCAIAVISPVTKTYERTQEQADAQMVAESLLEEIRGKTDMAATLVAEGNTIKAGGYTIAVNNNGYLTINDDPVFDGKFYKGKTVSLEAEQKESKTVEIILKILGPENKELFSVTSTLKPIV